MYVHMKPEIYLDLDVHPYTLPSTQRKEKDYLEIINRRYIVTTNTYVYVYVADLEQILTLPDHNYKAAAECECE